MGWPPRSLFSLEMQRLQGAAMGNGGQSRLGPEDYLIDNPLGNPILTGYKK